MNKKKRATNNGLKSKVAQDRKVLYKLTIGRVNKAISEGYFLEAITLIESMATDRLEARTTVAAAERKQFKNRKNELQPINPLSFTPLGTPLWQLCDAIPHEPQALLEIYSELKDWAKRRNEALHQMAKLAEGEDKCWHKEYSKAKHTAKDGLKLFRRLAKEVEKHNKNHYKTSK